MKVLSGKKIAGEIETELKEKIAAMEVVPCLAVIIVGDRPDSATYVRMKTRMCEKLGMRGIKIEMPVDVTQQEIEEQVELLNADETVHGILIQLPLPKHINERQVLSRVALEKDVDGFHSMNMGNLALNDNPLFVPCTPAGCVEILDREGIEIEGKHVVVLGRSRIVGLPLALMMLHRNATVTICHSRTQDIKEHTRRADILVCACGRPEMVKADWVREGVVVIDVGINSIDDATRKRGYRLVGDADYTELSEVAAAMTPVPGGVGPMTIIMLMSHTYRAALNHS